MSAASLSVRFLLTLACILSAIVSTMAFRTWKRSPYSYING
uniref:Secreted protein n=1 Tax=Haemonchus contortus TaxID=6289 RepID=A0A6F7PUV1_HAECO